jgi:hypothetical protein
VQPFSRFARSRSARPGSYGAVGGGHCTQPFVVPPLLLCSVATSAEWQISSEGKIIGFLPLLILKERIKKVAKVVQRANAQRLPKDYGIKRLRTKPALRFIPFPFGFCSRCTDKRLSFFPFFF